MKDIRLIKLSLLNFKGIRNLEINFNNDVTTISGRNGSGKTTVMDSFVWLLFGKDTLDRKQFNIKTLDENGKAIEKLPHEVTAILSINGEEVKLCRRYNEIWRRTRGESEPKFAGHEEERLYNDVPCNTSEWAEKINAIVSEENFKYLTNPSYFPSRKPDEQRRKLLEMAGQITDEDVAAGKPEFVELLAKLKGKTMDEYKREISNKKKNLKEEAEGIPPRIDERKRSIPQDEDWNAIETEIGEKEKEVASIEKQQSDIMAGYEESNKKRQGIAGEISVQEAKKQKRISDIKSAASKKYYEELQAQNERKNLIKTKEYDLETKLGTLKSLREHLEERQKRIAELRTQWGEIKARQIQFDPNEFVCPTCKRQFDIEDIEKKQAELEGNFNQKKAADLKANTEEGKKVSNEIKAAENKISGLENEIKALREEIEKLKTEKTDEVKEPDTTQAIAEDEELKQIEAKIKQLEADLGKPAEKPDTSELRQRKAELNKAITDLKIRLGKRDEIAKGNERIAELETQFKTLNDSISELEGIEFTMQEFSKRKSSLIGDRVNGLFQLVKFKMFDTQVNGAEVETCVATVNGVPYNDGLNQAAKVLAGLDIIGALQKHIGALAPVFLDNSESVNHVPEMPSQMILLRVTEDQTLSIR